VCEGTVKSYRHAVPGESVHSHCSVLYQPFAVFIDTGVPGGPLCDTGQLDDIAAEEYRIGWERKNKRC
jgi:hypothetical protein